MTNQLVSKRVIQNELGISPSTLKYWRLGRDGQQPKLTEGVHWLRVGPRKTLYNLELLRDFLHNQSNPEAHKRAISAYLESLASSRASA